MNGVTVIVVVVNVSRAVQTASITEKNMLLMRAVNGLKDAKTCDLSGKNDKIQ